MRATDLPPTPTPHTERSRTIHCQTGDSQMSKVWPFAVTDISLSLALIRTF